ncbi:hypothetical protein PCANC_28523 [Puccinia coronata f. sp. avenae]|uniref:Uncharacterized protein n=1 Tax=Puccinia coronata f. sp. avenae TaxID=200324 RepID=A0A2N5RXH3_9BASI|nr:hypothetical protein PCANC_28523 [Puccinia coronata f. sp. avenae]
MEDFSPDDDSSQAVPVVDPPFSDESGDSNLVVEQQLLSPSPQQREGSDSLSALNVSHLHCGSANVHAAYTPPLIILACLPGTKPQEGFFGINGPIAVGAITPLAFSPFGVNL